MDRRLILFLVPLFWASTNMGAQTEPTSRPTTVPYISIAETVELATRQYIDSAPPAEEFARWRRSNPAALPALYAILDDPQQARHHRKVMVTIAQAGSEEDLARLLNILDGLRGSSPEVRESVWGVRNAVETMRQRGVKGAREAVLEMCTPEFWSKFKFETADRRPRGYFTFPNDEAYHTIVTTGSDMDLTRTELLERLLERVPDRQQRKVIIDFANHSRPYVSAKMWLTPATQPSTESTTTRTNKS